MERFKYELLVPIYELIVPIEMVNLTESEGKLLLKIFKDFSVDYNANSISREVGLTPRGSLKILKKLEVDKLLRSKQLGKAVFYKATLDDPYTLKVIETLLMAEARKHAEIWIDEFKNIYKETEMILLFGSIIRNPQKANDVDAIFVFKKEKYNKIKNFVSEKNKTLFKKIHEIPQTANDLRDNLKRGNRAMIEAVKTGYVLYGQDNLVKIIKNVTRF